MKNSEEPAYPTYALDPESNKSIYYSGLTKREYFAVIAMQGLMYHFKDEGHELTHAENIARKAIRTADELLKQLES